VLADVGEQARRVCGAKEVDVWSREEKKRLGEWGCVCFGGVERVEIVRELASDL